MPHAAALRSAGLASLDEAGPMHLAFFDNLKYADQLATTRAGACLVSPRFEASVPAHVAVLRAAQPFRAFVTIARELSCRRAAPAILVRQCRHRALRRDRSDRASGRRRDRRSAGGDRSGRRDRRRYGDRLGCGDRRRRPDRPRLQRRRAYGDPVRADRQQRPDPSRLPASGRTATASCSLARTAI